MTEINRYSMMLEALAELKPKVDSTRRTQQPLPDQPPLSAVLAEFDPMWRPVPERPLGEPPERGAARLLWGLSLDLNRADVRELEALPGIGPGRARAIVAGRPHCALADLDRVPGIGPVSLRRLADKVRVGASPHCVGTKGD